MNLKLEFLRNLNHLNLRFMLVILSSCFLDLSHSETRLYCFIDGFEFHVYNQSGTYDSLEKLFGQREDDTDSCEIQEEKSGTELESKKNG